MGRIKTISVIFLVLICVLSIHFFNISALKHTELATSASNQRTRETDVKSWRGCIYDCNMIPLCDRTETKAQTVFGQDVSVTGRYSDNTVAKHLLGYIGSDGNGVSGIEKVYNHLLKTNEKSSVSYISDTRGNPIQSNSIPSNYSYSPENNVKLTLDYKIQKIAEQAADKYISSGAIVILDTQSFDIKAMVSRPDYNQNDIQSHINDNGSPLLNKALCSYNAGSIFKIITSASAIENNIDTQHFCSGKMTIDGKEFACHLLQGHKNVNFKTAFAKSCNCYFYNISCLIGGEKIVQTAEKFGLSDTLLNIPLNQDKGFLPTKQSYTPRESANICIGQGEILVTPLQVAYITAVIANDGIGKQINIADSIVDSYGKPIQNLRYESSHTVIPKSHALQIGDMMRECVLEGTAQNVQNGIVAVAGKTGSAETGWMDDNGNPMVHGWFCGFFPYENPEYAMAVFCENGRSGSESCIPAFREIVLDINKLYN